MSMSFPARVAAVTLCNMLVTSVITLKHEPAKTAFVRYGTFSLIVSACEDVTGNEHATLLNEQHFVDHDADLQSEFEKRASNHSHLESWSLLTRHGGQVAQRF